MPGRGSVGSRAKPKVAAPRRKAPATERLTHSRFADRFLATVLFTDIVGSTKLAAELGDQQFREVMHEHHRLVRTQIARWHGQVINAVGDAFFATFDVPARAIGCAWAIGRCISDMGIDIKAGIHVGECERVGEEVGGIAVHVGARVASKARPGQILVSKTVRDLVQGSGIKLRDRGSHVLKGVPGRWHLFVVEAVGMAPPKDGSTMAQSPIGVMLVDDHPLWRETVKRVLEHDEFATIVAEASDGKEAITMAQVARPDVVLMDLHLPAMNGIEATRAILEAHPDAKVLVLSSSDDPDDVLEAVEAGASGYLLKTAGANEIGDAVRRANTGELVFPPALSRVVLGKLRTRQPRPKRSKRAKNLIRERYEPLEVLGRGGQAEVVRALDHQHDRSVVLKVRKVASKSKREAILNEARVLLNLEPHHGVPLIREDFFDEGRYYLVMDWVEGRSLEQILSERGDPGLPYTTVIDYLTQVADALDHLHSHEPPVVHGDVKPANLILGARGKVTLVDFGIANETRGAASKPYGSAGYAAPEVAERRPPTAASDIYGLAATAFALLSGSPPGGDAPTWEGIPVVIVPYVERVLRRGLSNEPKRRPGSAGELVKDLSLHFGDAPQGQLETIPRRLRRGTR